MSEYGQGVRTGYETTYKGNPFSSIIKRVDEARARQLADQKDLRELQQVFQTLEKQNEYATILQNEKSKQERLTELFKGISSGQIEVDDVTGIGGVAEELKEVKVKVCWKGRAGKIVGDCNAALTSWIFPYSSPCTITAAVAKR